MIDLQNEWDLVRIFPTNRTQDTESGRHGVAAPLDRQFHDILWIEIKWIRCERGPAAVFDALINRKNRKVTCVRQPTMVKHGLHIP